MVTPRKCSTQLTGLQISARSFTYPRITLIAIWIVGSYCSNCRYIRRFGTGGTFEVVNHTIHSFIRNVFLVRIVVCFCAGNRWIIADGIALSRKYQVTHFFRFFFFFNFFLMIMILLVFVCACVSVWMCLLHICQNRCTYIESSIDV